jgi:hypothetical protein
MEIRSNFLCLISKTVKYLLHFVNCYSPFSLWCTILRKFLGKMELNVYTNRCVCAYEIVNFLWQQAEM